MRRSPEKAKLLFRQKLGLPSGLLRDAVIWKVPVSERYLDGVKYRLALVNPLTGEVIILFDNHFPKGHHQHLRGGEEISYNFRSPEKLVEDYLEAIQNEENKP